VKSDRATTVIVLASAVGVAALLLIGAPGIKLSPAKAVPLVWCLLFYGICRGLKLPRQILIVWCLAVIVVLARSSTFELWGLGAFEALLIVQVTALCTQEFTPRTS
jgi:hypothetical protein